MIKLSRPNKPTFWHETPLETTTLITKVKITEDEKFSIPKDTKWITVDSITEAERGYGYGPDKSYVEISFHTDERPNPNIEAESIEYKNAWDAYCLKVSSWERTIKEIERQEDIQNKALLEELKAKYENKN